MPEKKLLLINPPLKNFEENPYPPLGLAYVAAIIERKGFKVQVFDMPVLKADLKDAQRYLEISQPDIIGISCVAANYSIAIALAKLAKKIFNCLVLMGGPHVTFVAEEILRENQEVDMTVRGEGELTMLEIMNATNNGNQFQKIAGITYRDSNGFIHTNPDRPLIRNLDGLPYPARHLLPMQEYRNLTKYTSILGSRGCVYNCIYCSSSAFWRRKLRFRNLRGVIDEIEKVRRRYGFTYFKFLDDVFMLNGRGRQLLEMLKETHVKWSCNARVDTVDEKTLKIAAEAGCVNITFGVETCSEGTLRTINKNINITQIKNAVKWAKENKIETKLNFIFGLPNQNEEDILKCFELIEKLKPSKVMFGPLIPYPATEITENSKKYGITFKKKNWWKYGLETSSVNNNELSYNEILHLISLGKRKLDNLQISVVNVY